jgi:phage-related protein
MPGTASDVAFTFDPGAVLGGVKKINQSMTNMTRQVAQGAQSMAKSVSRGILRAAAIVGSLKAAVAGVRNLMKRMPEVSQAFDIARDVIFKNLLWPLRQRVMPMLQRMLDWVRDNRETFARWGQVVANVFDIVVKGVRGAVDAVRALWERAGMLLGRIFGDGTQSIEETMNLLTAKLAVTMEFVGGVIRRVMDWILGLVERNLPAVAQLLSNIVGTVRMLAERYGGMILSGIERIIEFVLDLANKHWPAFGPRWWQQATSSRGG